MFSVIYEAITLSWYLQNYVVSPHTLRREQVVGEGKGRGGEGGGVWREEMVVGEMDGSETKRDGTGIQLRLRGNS